MKEAKGKGIEQIMNTVHDMYRRERIANMVEVPSEFLFHRTDGTNKPQGCTDGDYVGCVDGVAVAVSVSVTIYTVMHEYNVQPCQIDFLRDWEKCGGKAFFLVYYHPTEFAVVPFSEAEKLADGIPLSDIPLEARIPRREDAPVDYMKAVKWYLSQS